MISLQLFGAATTTQKADTTKKADTPKIELDDAKIEKNASMKPAFSRSSADQAQIDASLDQKQEEFDEQVFKHMESFEECRKLGSINEIQKCNNDSVKIKKNKQ